MPYKHGVYISEQPTSLAIPIEGTAGLQVIVGTAPVNMVGDPYAAVNTPIICYSFKEAVSRLGYSSDFENYTLCQSIDACFRVFNVAPIILINVLDPANSRHTTSVTASDKQISEGQVLLEDIGILMDSVVVQGTGERSSNKYTVDKDYTLSFDDEGRVIVSVLPAGSIPQDLNLLSIAYKKLKPDGVTQADIIGTYDQQTGKETGFELIRQIYPTFGMTPGLLLAPGWSHNPEVCAAMEAKCTGINGVFSCECIVDISTDPAENGAVLYSGVKKAKEALGADSKHTACVWPMAKVGSKKYYMSAIFGALTAYTDANNQDIPSVSPSNEIFGITGVCLKDDTEVLLDQEQANLVNSYGVITALNMNGYKSWGNNTAIYPSSTDPKDRWFCCRRFFSWWGNSLILTYFQRVDDPANYRLIESIVDSENIRGNSYVARGFCAAARVEFIKDENPITDILNGKIQFHVYLAPYTPAEDIEFLLEFDPTAIEKALTGGDE